MLFSLARKKIHLRRHINALLYLYVLLQDLFYFSGTWVSGTFSAMEKLVGGKSNKAFLQF